MKVWVLLQADIISENYIKQKIKWSVTELIAGELDFASIYRNINKRTYLIARAA